MQKFFLLLALFLLASQIADSQTKVKQQKSKFPDEKSFILSCSSSMTSMSQTKVLNSKAIKLVKPLYPKELLEERKRGSVNVWVNINEKGEVVSAAAVSGDTSFRQLAVEAVKKSLFKRFVRCGKPVKVAGTVIYNFIPPE